MKQQQHGLGEYLTWETRPSSPIGPRSAVLAPLVSGSGARSSEPPNKGSVFVLVCFHFGELFCSLFFYLISCGHHKFADRDSHPASYDAGRRVVRFRVGPHGGERRAEEFGDAVSGAQHGRAHGDRGHGQLHGHLEHVHAGGQLQGATWTLTASASLYKHQRRQRCGWRRSLGVPVRGLLDAHTLPFT